MRTFEDYPYEQPNMKEINERFNSLLKKLSNAGSIEAVKSIIKEINLIRSSFSTMMNIAYIRATVDTTDEFYQNESNYFDKIEPEFEDLETRYYRGLIDSPFRKEWEKEYGDQLFQLAEYKVKSFSPETKSCLFYKKKIN